MSIVDIDPTDYKSEVNNSGPNWLWAAYVDENVASVLAAIDAAPKATLGRRKGFAVGSTAEWVKWSGLSEDQLNRALPKIKQLPFIRHGTWLRPRQTVGSSEGRRAVWLAIDKAGVPEAPPEPYWRVHWRSAPWRKPRKPKRRKIDHKALPALKAAIAKLRRDWDGEPVGNAALSKPKVLWPGAIKKKARAIAFAQRDGNWICAAGWLVDLLGMVGTQTLRKVPVSDLWVLDWGFYAGVIDVDQYKGDMPDFEKAKPVPMQGWEANVRSLERLLADQKKAVIEAGFKRPKTPKSASAKTAKIYLQK